MIMRLSLTIILTMITILSLPFRARPAEPDNPLSVLLDDVNKVYVIDESVCSSMPSSKDSDVCYIIEGSKDLQLIRDAFSEISIFERGACGCGGPDVHYYGELSGGMPRYFGLDCELFLEGFEIPDSLISLLLPSHPEFLGHPQGYTYIVDIPVEFPESTVHSIFSEAGLVILVGGYWNMATGFAPRDLALDPIQANVDEYRS